MKIRKLAGMTAATVLLSPLPAAALTQAELDEMVTTARHLTHRYEEQQRTIHALHRRVQELEQRLLGASNEHLAVVRGRGDTPISPSGNPPMAQAIAQVNNGYAPQVAQNAQSLPGVDPSAASTQQTATQQQAIATSQGEGIFDRRFTIEQGLTYTHYDRRSLVLNGFLALDAILLGQIDLQQIKTDQLQYDITARWNWNDRLSTDVNLPMLYRRANYISGGAGGSAASVSDASSDSMSVGDANLGLYYQLPKSVPTDLDWIASVRLRAPTGRHPFGIKLRSPDPSNNNLVVPSRQPTGNGIWGASVGVAVLKTLDPLVLFGNIGITYNVKRSFDDLSSVVGQTQPGDVKLGNALSFGAGFAAALN